MKRVPVALIAVIAATVLSACGEDSYVNAPPWKESDKHLTCEQLLLEVNDAKYWNKVAAEKKKAGITDILWPVGYIGTRSSAAEAMDITGARISNLQNIYNIKGCARPYPNVPVPSPM